MTAILTEEFSKKLLAKIGISPIPRIINVETSTRYYEIPDADYGYLNAIWLINRDTGEISKTSRQNAWSSERDFEIPINHILIRKKHYPQTITFICRPDEIPPMLSQSDDEISKLSTEEKIMVALAGGLKSSYRIKHLQETMEYANKKPWTVRKYNQLLEHCQEKGILGKNKALNSHYRLIYNNNWTVFKVHDLVRLLP